MFKKIIICSVISFIIYSFYCPVNKRPYLTIPKSDISYVFLEGNILLDSQGKNMLTLDKYNNNNKKEKFRYFIKDALNDNTVIIERRSYGLWTTSDYNINNLFLVTNSKMLEMPDEIFKNESWPLYYPVRLKSSSVYYAIPDNKNNITIKSWNYKNGEINIISQINNESFHNISDVELEDFDILDSNNMIILFREITEYIITESEEKTVNKKYKDYIYYIKDGNVSLLVETEKAVNMLALNDRYIAYNDYLDSIILRDIKDGKSYNIRLPYIRKYLINDPVKYKVLNFLDDNKLFICISEFKKHINEESKNLLLDCNNSNFRLYRIPSSKSLFPCTDKL